MRQKGKRLEDINHELKKFNDKFHGKQLINDFFYFQIKEMGCDYCQCILVDLFPDGNNTYIGKIIRQDGRVILFDIDLDDFEYSSWKDITDEFMDKYKKNRTSKPWLKEVISYELFCNLNCHQ